MAANSQTSLPTSDKTCSTTTESTTSLQTTNASPSSATTNSIIYDHDRDYGGVAYEAANRSKPLVRPAPTSIDSQAAILQWQATLMNQTSCQQAANMWTCDQTGFHLVPGTIFVQDVGVRPLTDAWFHLVLGRHVLNHEWQPVTAESLERLVNPEKNVDPIILRQHLWKTMPADAWWNMTHGAKQPGLDVDMISTYYGQRCDRSTQEVSDDLSMRRLSSTSGAGILVKSGGRRDSMLDSGEIASSVFDSVDTESFGPKLDQTCLEGDLLTRDSVQPGS